MDDSLNNYIMSRSKGVIVFNVFFVIYALCNIRVLKASLEVETQNGFVIGRQISDSLYGWSGIPFAKPPLGNLRFEVPEAPDNWTGTWDATYDRSQCVVVETASLPDSLIYPQGNEDCLYINVYSSKLPTNGTLLPVMVWIYGGGFIDGNSSYTFYGPDRLVAKEVVFVSFNYRVGIFGFLSTNDNVAPGNVGLKDQVFALKWVQNNIKAFGGDPNQVTIFGGSAGAASVSYLTLSPLAKGLFSKAVTESGSALCLWALSRTARKAAFATGKELGIITNKSQDLVTRLKTVPAYNLQRAACIVMGAIFGADPLNGLVYAPVIEPPNDGAAVTAASYEELKRGNFNQVPLLMGYNSAEATGLINGISLLSLYLATYDIIPTRLVPASMNANAIDVLPIGVQIRNFYAGVLGTMAFPGDNFVRYFSDDEFVRPIQKTANLMSKYVEIYFYQFSYTRDPNAVGASHAAELPYLFNINGSDAVINSPSDEYIKECMVEAWTSFAKTGNPTASGACGGADWQPIGPNDRSDLRYININRVVTTGINPDAKNITFWNNLFDRYAHPPFITF
ncbi:hypothetical protein Trydic_g1307 [Trypoxylus dichotomus]